MAGFVRRFPTATFRAIGISARARSATFFRVSPRWTRFHQVVNLKVDRQLLDISWRPVESPTISPEIMAHLRRNLPGWQGFRAPVYTFIEQSWNTTYGDLETPADAEVYEEVGQIGQRDRLEQIFAACPPGSYGYYAQWGLAPFKAVFGNLAAATIDEFFAKNVHLLIQPMSAEITDILSGLETKYWDSSKDIIDYIAGKVLSKRTRAWAVATPAALRRLWEGERTPTLPAGEELDTAQAQEIADVLNENLPQLDLEAAQRFAEELCEQAVAENRVRIAEKQPEEHT